MSDTATPEILWAQRSSADDADKNFLYLTISVPDVPKEESKLDLQSKKLTFTGTSTTDKRKYHVEIEFFAEINPDDSKINHTGKNFELKLVKKELGQEYWPRLTDGKEKRHYIKTDFDKWVDEDEQDEAPEEDFSQFGGMGGMPGMGAGGDYGGIDFSKLGGGAPDMPPDLGGLGQALSPEDIAKLSAGAGAGDEEDDDDEDDLPDLAEDKPAGKPAAKP